MNCLGFCSTYIILAARFQQRVTSVAKTGTPEQQEPRETAGILNHKSQVDHRGRHVIVRFGLPSLLHFLATCSVPIISTVAAR
jgi:hypothetical protein